jgi:glycosyltransferase involved in cell wall biosynthesis
MGITKVPCDRSAQSIVIAYYSNPQYAPPVANAIRRLSRDYKVTVVARNFLRDDGSYPDNVVVHRVGRHVSSNDESRPIYRKILDTLTFIVRTCTIARKEHPCALLAFDMHGAVASWAARRCLSHPAVWIYHQNETALLAEIPRTRLAHWLKRLELRLASKPDVISFPEPNRAKLFLADAGLERDFTLVENCPPVLSELPRVHPQMADLRNRGHRIVLYQGAIGPGIDLDLAIRSIRFWPADSVLVVVGHRSEAQREQMMATAREEGIVERLITVPFVGSHVELLRYTVAATAGLILYRGHDMNTRYAAPNKLYEYLACGVPVVVPARLPYVSQMVSSLNVGTSYSHPTPEAIGEAVSSLLDKAGQREMVERARNVHLSRLNFDAQFQPLLDAIAR